MTNSDTPRRAWLAPLTLLAAFALLAWRFALLRQTDLAIAEWRLLGSFWTTGSFDSSWLGVNYLAQHWRPLLALFAVPAHFMPGGSVAYEWWQALYYTAVIAHVQWHVRVTTGDAPLAAAAALLLAVLAFCLPHLYPLAGVALWCARAARPPVFLGVAVLYFADAGDCGTLAGAAALCAAGAMHVGNGGRARGRLYLATGLTALCAWLVLQSMLPEYGFGGHAARRFAVSETDAWTLVSAVALAALAAGWRRAARAGARRAAAALLVLAAACGAAGGYRLLSPGDAAEAGGALPPPAYCRSCARRGPAEVALPASRPGIVVPPAADLAPVRVRPDGIVIPLLAGTAEHGDTALPMALSIATTAGDSVRLPFGDRRFTDMVFVPMELLHEGANALRVELWCGTECVQRLPLTVALDLTPPALTETDGALVATDEASALRVLAWQPARGIRPLAVGFHRRPLINAWAHFWRDPECAARRSFAIDPGDLDDGDLLWLEDAAGNAATYARADGKWKLLGTRNFLHVDKPAGLPADWDLPVPACP